MLHVLRPLLARGGWAVLADPHAFLDVWQLARVLQRHLVKEGFEGGKRLILLLNYSLARGSDSDLLVHSIVLLLR